MSTCGRGARGLGLRELGAADLAAVGGDGGVERHVLRLEGRHAQAAARPDATERGGQERLAHRRRGPLDHDGARAHRRRGGEQAATKPSATSGFDAKCACTYEPSTLLGAVAFGERLAAATLAHAIGVAVARLRASSSGTGGRAGAGRRRRASVAALRLDLDVAERLQAIGHDRGAGDEPDHRVRGAVDGADGVGEVHEAAALGVDGPAAPGGVAQRGAHRAVGGERGGVQLGIATAEVDAVDGVGQRGVGERREGDELGAERAQGGEVVLVVEVEGGVVRERDAAARRGGGGGVAAATAAAAPSGGGAAGEGDEGVDVVPLGEGGAPRGDERVGHDLGVGGAQAEVTLGKRGRARRAAGRRRPARAPRHACFSSSRWPREPTWLANSAGEVERGIERAQPEADGGDGARHAAGVDDGDDRRARATWRSRPPSPPHRRATRRRRGP